MEVSLSNVMLMNAIIKSEIGGAVNPRKPKISIAKPISRISLLAMIYSPPPSFLDEIFPSISTKRKINVSFFSWSFSDYRMLSDKIVIQCKTICHILCRVGIVHSSHDLETLLQSSTPSLNRHVLHSLFDWRNFEMFYLWKLFSSNLFLELWTSAFRTALLSFLFLIKYRTANLYLFSVLS